MTRNGKILIVLHQPTSTPGRIGRGLRMRGFDLELRYPVMGDALPATLEGYAGVVVFGGPGSVNDDCAHYRQVIDWLDVPLRENVPYIGICLGGQMLARFLGARVAPHPQGRWEVGYYPVRPTDAGRKLWACWPEMVFQWHAEGFELPTGAELLLEGLGDFPNQAFRFGERAFGLQFHPEVTTHMLHRWTVRSADKLRMPGARSRHELFEGKMVYDPAVACWLESFLDHWLALGRHRHKGAASVTGEKRNGERVALTKGLKADAAGEDTAASAPSAVAASGRKGRAGALS